MKSNKAYKDMTKQERREAAQARAQAALDRLGDGIRSVWESEAWRWWLDTLAKFHDYSLNNSVLIAMQMPEATRVASYRSWKRDFDRHVRRGERGIEVLVPMVVKSKLGEDDETPQGDGETTERRREAALPPQQRIVPNAHERVPHGGGLDAAHRAWRRDPPRC